MGAVSDFVLHHYRHFNAAALVDAARGWGAHLDNSHRALPGDVVPLIAQAIVYAALGLYFMRRFYLPAARRAADTL